MQISNRCICKYCLGCVAMDTKEFIPKMSCAGFVPAYADWKEKYYAELSKKGFGKQDY